MKSIRCAVFGDFKSELQPSVVDEDGVAQHFTKSFQERATPGSLYLLASLSASSTAAIEATARPMHKMKAIA